MAYSIANNPLLRKNFAKIHKIIDIPNLIDIQKNSYKRFLQLDTPVDARKNSGLEAVFRSVFPIKDFSDTASLEYVSYSLGAPEVRRGRVPPARDDLCGPDEGEGEAGCLGCHQGPRYPIDP